MFIFSEVNVSYGIFLTMCIAAICSCELFIFSGDGGGGGGRSILFMQTPWLILFALASLWMIYLLVSVELIIFSVSDFPDSVVLILLCAHKLVYLAFFGVLLTKL